VEGARAIDAVLRGTAGVEYLLSAPQPTPRSEQVLRRGEQQDVPVYALTETQAQELSTVVHSQGVFAIVHWRPADRPPTSLAPLHLHLSGLRNPVNMGAVLRSARAFAVSTSCSPDCVDVTHPTALRSGAGTYLDLPLYTDITLGDLQAHHSDHQCIYATATGGEPITTLQWPERSILVLGGEAEGATEPIYKGMSVSIPVTIESLNAAVACGILLWEAVCRGPGKPLGHEV
jgi:tRNA G18 (ribose-2'-O)-methylase SpoU